MNNITPLRLRSHRSGPLKGGTAIPGDKSISHRSLILGATATGTTRIRHMLESEDIMRTATALINMGVNIQRDDDGLWHVHGVGTGGLMSPSTVLEMGNSGTSTRLFMGLLASQPVTAVLTGDESLCRRPMARVITPLIRFGARFDARAGDRLPLTVHGCSAPVPITFTPPVASAQVKSAILLAGLNTPGTTTVHEARATRDHTERMLKAMGARITVKDDDHGRTISVIGEEELSPLDITVPGDISSATFPLVAAAIRPQSDITLTAIGINPLRTGILDALQQMGTTVTLLDIRDAGGEPVADIRLQAPRSLKAISPDPAVASDMIDEFPALFVAAACATGTSHFTGLSELRVKESDRLHVMATILAANGVAVEELPDGLVVHGTGAPPKGGAEVDVHLDHRMAMAALVLGCATENPVTISDGHPIATSFPGFIDLMNSLNADMIDL